MSLFKESVWDTDETGDKLSKDLFVKGVSIKRLKLNPKI